MEKLSVILDADVIINWLCQEVETVTHKELWKAPLCITENVEQGKVLGNVCLVNLMEIRFVLRRKKNKLRKEVEQDIQSILGIYQSIVPDEITLLRANRLQSEEELDPFDSILLSTAMTIPEIHLIARDSPFTSITQKYVSTHKPEEFVDKFGLEQITYDDMV